MHMLILLTAGLLCQTTVTCQINDAPQTLTLEKAVQQALEHRPDIEASSYAIQASKSTANGTWAPYYPNVTFGSSMDQEKGDSMPYNTSTITYNQLIYSFAGPQRENRKAKQLVKISESDAETVKNRIRLEVEKAFLQAWFLQENRDSIISLLTSNNKMFQQAKHKNKLDLLDRNEWFKSVENYANNTTIIDQFNDSLRLAFNQLEFLMGQPLKLQRSPNKKTSHGYIHLEQPLPKALSLQPLSTYVSSALKHHPDLKQAEAKVGLERENIRLAQGARLPTISAYGLAQHTGVQFLPNQHMDQGYFRFGVTLNWSLFDGGVSYYQEEVAHANKLKAMLTQQQTVLTIKQQVHEHYFTLSKTFAQLRAQKARYLRAKNEWSLREKEYAIGALAQPEFAVTQTTWKQEKLAWLSCKVDAASQYRELLAACSYPAELE